VISVLVPRQPFDWFLLRREVETCGSFRRNAGPPGRSAARARWHLERGWDDSVRSDVRFRTEPCFRDGRPAVAVDPAGAPTDIPLVPLLSTGWPELSVSSKGRFGRQRNLSRITRCGRTETSWGCRLECRVSSAGPCGVHSPGPAAGAKTGSVPAGTYGRSGD